MFTKRFCQLVQGPGAESSLLDPHWTNHQEKVSHVHEYFQGASDHRMICIVRTTKRVIKKRVVKMFDPK